MRNLKEITRKLRTLRLVFTIIWLASAFIVSFMTNFSIYSTAVLVILFLLYIFIISRILVPQRMMMLLYKSPKKVKGIEINPIFRAYFQRVKQDIEPENEVQHK